MLQISRADFRWGCARLSAETRQLTAMMNIEIQLSFDMRLAHV